MSLNELNRRKFLQTSILVGGTAALAACAAPASAPAAPAATTVPAATAAEVAATEPAADATGAPEAAAPSAATDPAFPMDDAAKNPLGIGTDPVDGVFFSGGFGHDYIIYAGKLVETAHPGVKVSVKPIQKVAEELRPRLVDGNPPDVIDNSGAGQFPTTDLANEGQLADLSELFEAASWDTPGVKFKDTLFPGSQDNLVYDGKQLGVNIAYTISALWYSKPWLDKAGYTLPTTWADFLALCETIKTEGKMAPFTYQGKYPYYMWGIVLNQLMYKAAGNDAIIAIDNLEPNAWKNPDVLRAVTDMYALYDKGYIMEGTAGLTHTESQAEWLRGKAAFIPCGTWLENEMKDQTPAGFDMTAMGVPGYTDGKGDINAVAADGGEPFVVFAKGKNVKGGMEFLRAQLSRTSSKWFAENVSSIMPVSGVTGLKASAGVQSALAVVEKAGANIIQFKMPGWYSSIGGETGEIQNRTGELLTGKIKPEEFVDAMQKKADEVAADPDVVKFKREK